MNTGVQTGTAVPTRNVRMIFGSHLNIPINFFQVLNEDDLNRFFLHVILNDHLFCVAVIRMHLVPENNRQNYNDNSNDKGHKKGKKNPATRTCNCIDFGD